MADPRLPAQVAARLASGELAEALSAGVTPGTRWQVEVVIEALPLDEQRTVPIVDLGARAGTQWGSRTWPLALTRVSTRLARTR